MSDSPNFLGTPGIYSRNDVSLSWSDYLQKREFSDRQSHDISAQTKALITSQDRVLNAQIRQMEQLGHTIESSVNEAAYQISISMRDLQDETVRGFDRIGSVLEWGFQEQLQETRKTNQILSELLSITRAPAKTWAEEQFDLARDEVRRCLFSEAFASVNRAIDGHGDHVGVRSQARYHHFRGVLRLGSFSNHDAALIDLPDAEQSFLQAARCARVDDRRDAAISLMYAARAANLQLGFDDAVRHAREGIGLRPLAGLHYECAKALACLDREDEAMDHLKRALRMDKNLILSLPGESEFRSRAEFVDRCLSELLAEARTLLRSALDWAHADLRKARSVGFSSATILYREDLESVCGSLIVAVEQWIAAGQRVEKRGGLLDVRLTLEEFAPAHHSLATINGAFQDAVGHGLHLAETQQETTRGQALAARRAEHQAQAALLGRVPMFVGGGIGSLALISSLASCSGGQIGDGIGMLFGGGIGALFCGWVATGICALIARSNETEWRAGDAGVREDYGQMIETLRRERGQAASLIFYAPSKDALQLLPSWSFRPT